MPGCSACDKASSASVNLSRARAAAEPAAEAAPAADAAAAAAEVAPAEAVPARAPALRRLWLTGSLGASPGAFGFFRTAHAEPLGDRLRLLLDYDLPSGIPPVDGTRVAVTGAPRPPPCPPPRPEIPPVHGYQAIMHCSVSFTRQVPWRSATAGHGLSYSVARACMPASPACSVAAEPCCAAAAQIGRSGHSCAAAAARRRGGAAGARGGAGPGAERVPGRRVGHAAVGGPILHSAHSYQPKCAEHIQGGVWDMVRWMPLPGWMPLPRWWTCSFNVQKQACSCSWSVHGRGPQA